MNVLRTIGLALATFALIGCNASGWSADLTAEQLPEAAPVPNSVAITLGPDSWPTASSQLTGELSSVWPNGVVIPEGASQIDTWGATLADSLVEWEELTVELGVLTLAAGPEGLELRAEIAYEDVPLMIQSTSYGACPVTVGMAQGNLSSMLTLSATKLGRIQANPMSEVGWWAEDFNVDLSSCPPEFRTAIEEVEGLGVFHQTLSEHTIAALSPWLASAVPDVLGLSLGNAAKVEYTGDGTGTGSIRWALRAPETETGVGSHYADGQLVVPFGLAMDVEPHPCVPSVDFTGPPGAGLPSVTDERAVIVNQATMRRALRATWSAGAYCNRRITDGLSWAVSDLSPIWEGLSILEEDSEVTLRLWPETLPTLVAEEGDSGVEMRVEAGLWTLELMGVRQGAVVRLASLKMRLEITADLDVANDGSIWLSPTTTDVTALGTTDGLLRAPELDVAQALAPVLSERLLASTPVGWLPDIPGFTDARVRLSGAHLVFFAQD